MDCTTCQGTKGCGKQCDAIREKEKSSQHCQWSLLGAMAAVIVGSDGSASFLLSDGRACMCILCQLSVLTAANAAAVASSRAYIVGGKGISVP
jgi:hypothetical protein